MATRVPVHKWDVPWNILQNENIEIMNGWDTGGDPLYFCEGTDDFSPVIFYPLLTAVLNPGWQTGGVDEFVGIEDDPDMIKHDKFGMYCELNKSLI